MSDGGKGELERATELLRRGLVALGVSIVSAAVTIALAAIVVAALIGGH